MECGLVAIYSGTLEKEITREKVLGGGGGVGGGGG